MDVDYVVQGVIALAAQRVDGDDAVRGQCLCETPEVGDRRVARGVELDEWDAIVVEERREALAGWFFEVSAPERTRAGSAGQGTCLKQPRPFARAEEHDVTRRLFRKSSGNTL
ncbi:MAG: hypothetical protein KY462_16770 [Actinobacteria bacterium]|nr:hypothetical protein [Actinomycetota bacterium]